MNYLLFAIWSLFQVISVYSFRQYFSTSFFRRCHPSSVQLLAESREGTFGNDDGKNKTGIPMPFLNPMDTNSIRRSTYKEAPNNKDIKSLEDSMNNMLTSNSVGIIPTGVVILYFLYLASRIIDLFLLHNIIS
jgi:hypothetical protein